MTLLERLRAWRDRLFAAEQQTDHEHDRIEIEREIARLEERLRLVQRRVESRHGRNA